MFGHKARQFAEFERRQAVEPFYEFAGGRIRKYASKRDYQISKAVREMISQSERNIETIRKNRARFRGYAYKGVAGKV